MTLVILMTVIMGWDIDEHVNWLNRKWITKLGKTIISQGAV